jgi:hypothetical protein
MSAPGGLSIGQVEELVGRYRAGESIRDLAAAYGLAYTTTRRALLYAGVDLRPRGGDHRWCKRAGRGPESAHERASRSGSHAGPGPRVGGTRHNRVMAP